MDMGSAARVARAALRAERAFQCGIGLLGARHTAGLQRLADGRKVLSAVGTLERPATRERPLLSKRDQVLVVLFSGG